HPGRTPSPMNRLQHSNSLYLRQHRDNPVDWHPWGKAALALAKKENKLIFLSIGYSTCHWCHVMEEESFENEALAALLNRDFICIKVDREERPDLDKIYMTAVQAMTGTGGWPLNIFLTPDLKPFFGGTYFPLEDKFGRSGMMTLVPLLAKLWKEDPDKILGTGDRLTAVIQRTAVPDETAPLTAALLDGAFRNAAESFDGTYGGFGEAPKFPQGMTLALLLRYHHRTGNGEALKMVEKTLDRMAEGGIYDQLGGGFHRYATDKKWLVPHFEKMLYDNAVLSQLYVEAYQATGKEHYGRIAREIFNYVLRDLTDPDGAFYSAEDADS
ncbi:MAG: thioredoxin domain-containing protein, partial [bacterium]|nr:thioredoxin domain-containing protein [bacterium]